MIGDNGSGKTTILEAITKAFVPILRAVNGDAVKQCDLTNNDIRHGSTSVAVTVGIELDGEEYVWTNKRRMEWIVQQYVIMKWKSRKICWSIEDCFVINNVSIIQGKDNLFVAMPSYKTKKMDENDRPIYQDVSYPITKDFREKLYGTILETHQKECEKTKQNAERLPNQRECVRTDVQKRETR